MRFAVALTQTRSLLSRAHHRPHLLFRTMSAHAAIARLPSPLKELVLASVQPDAAPSEKDAAEVDAWIGRVADGAIKPEALAVCVYMAGPLVALNTWQDLETQLTPRTYAVGNAFSAADAALYGSLHPHIVSTPSSRPVSSV
jgi:aminoacyl tRNA synthase complex-interacting multifunctional protein 1